MAKPAADLLNPKRKGRFRRLRRQSAAAQSKGSPLKGSVVSPVALGDGVIVTLRDLGRGLTREQLSKHVWRSQDGRLLPVTEMRDAHLMNTMDMLTKQREQALKIGLMLQTQDRDKSRVAYRVAARKAQWLMVMEAELLRRHPTYLGRQIMPTKPSGQELRAMPDFFDAGVLHHDA